MSHTEMDDGRRIPSHSRRALPGVPRCGYRPGRARHQHVAATRTRRPRRRSGQAGQDLSIIGSYGITGVNDVDYLVYQVAPDAGPDSGLAVVIVGAGNLGRALADLAVSSRRLTISAMLTVTRGYRGQQDREV